MNQMTVAGAIYTIGLFRISLVEPTVFQLQVTTAAQACYSRIKSYMRVPTTIAAELLIIANYATLYRMVVAS